MASLHLFPHFHHFDSIIHHWEILSHTRRQSLSPKAPINGGAAPETAKPNRKAKNKKNQTSMATIDPNPDSDPELADYDDGIDFPYEEPPLICCFGAVQKDFVPVVRVHDNPMHPDIYAQWKMLQWDPTEFV